MKPEYLTLNSILMHVLITLCEGVEHKLAPHFAAGPGRGGTKFGAPVWSPHCMWVQASLCLEYYAVMVGGIRYPSPEIHLRKTSAGSPWGV